MSRILIHTLVFPPDAVSNGYILGDLARLLRDLGHEITVLTTTPHYNPPTEAGGAQELRPGSTRHWAASDFHGIACHHVRVSPQKGRAGRRFATAFRFHALSLLRALGPDFRCDLVLSQSPPLSAGLVGACIAKRYGAKAIYVAQDIFPDGLIEQGTIRNPVTIALLRALERQVYARSDAVCSISQSLVETLRPRVPHGSLLRCIPNFVDCSLYRPLPRDNDFARSHGFADRFVVSYLGNLGNAQDFSPLLAAARECTELPITFLIVGGGIKYAWLREQIDALGLRNVELWSHQPRSVTPWINASTDLALVLLSPHVQNNSFPSKVYTLMACGKPILAYADPRSDLASFLRAHQVGTVVANGDVAGFVSSLRELFDDRQALSRFAGRGVAAIAEQYTAQAVARQYDALIRELVS